MMERVWQRSDVSVDPLIGQGGIAASPMGPVITVHGLESSGPAQATLRGDGCRTHRGLATPHHQDLFPRNKLRRPTFRYRGRDDHGGSCGPGAPNCMDCSGRGHGGAYRNSPGLVHSAGRHALHTCGLGERHVHGRTEAGAAHDRPQLGIRHFPHLRGRCRGIRNVVFGYEGTVYFGRLDPQNAWESALPDLTDVVTSLADHLQYAAIRRSRLQKALWSDFMDHWWPQRAYLAYGRSQGRFVADTYCSDAFGAQLLGPGHKLPPLSEKWRSRPVGSRSTLLIHTDAMAWFDGGSEDGYKSVLPEPTTLEHARLELAPLLLTDERASEAHKQKFAQAPPPRVRLP